MAKSEHARAAAAIRKLIKTHGLKATVRGSSYSMGSSVHATVINPSKEQYQAIAKEAGQYQYGHFDGMIDMYENTNCRDDIPQVKHVIIQTEYTPELRQRAWDIVRSGLSGMKDAPADENDSWRFNHPDTGQSGVQLINEVINGGFGEFRI